MWPWPLLSRISHWLRTSVGPSSLYTMPPKTEVTMGKDVRQWMRCLYRDKVWWSPKFCDERTQIGCHNGKMGLTMSFWAIHIWKLLDCSIFYFDHFFVWFSIKHTMSRSKSTLHYVIWPWLLNNDMDFSWSCV